MKYCKGSAALFLLATTSSVAIASQQPPVSLPGALADIGGPASGCPYIINNSAQSVGKGQDHNGPHNNPPNTYITDSVFSPTAFVPAVYGSTPLNIGTDGAGGQNVTTSTAANTYIMPAVSYAWYLRQSGLIPASRPIVIVDNSSPSKGITYWADQLSPFDLWSPVVTQYNLLNAGIAATNGTVLTTPGAAPCPINEWMWDQGQNDASGTYGTASAYLQAFTHKSVNTVTFSTGTPGLVNDTAHGLIAGNAVSFTGGTEPTGITAGVNYYVIAAGLTANAFEISATQGGSAINLTDAGSGTITASSLGVVPKFQSLPNWGPQTRGDVAEMGVWPGATGSARNDTLRSTDSGCLYPWLTMVSAQGLAMSSDNPLVHPNGYGSDTLGYRSFLANYSARAGGTFKCPTYTGKPQILNVASFALTPTFTIATPGVVNTTSQNWQAGQAVVFTTTGALPTGLTAGTVYYVQAVQSPTAITVAASIGGAAIAFSGTPSGTATLTAPYMASEDEVRNGVNYQVTGSIVLPNAAVLSGQPVYLYSLAGGTAYAQGTMNGENFPGTTASFKLVGGVLYQAYNINGSAWWLGGISGRYGNQYCNYGAALLTGAQAYSGRQLATSCISLNGSAMTLTAGFGEVAQFYALSGTNTLTMASGNFLLPDGTTATAISMLPSQTIGVTGIVTTANGLITQASYLNGSTPMERFALTGTSHTIPNGTAVARFTQSGTIAAQTLVLPAVTQDGWTIDLQNEGAGAVTALTMSPAVSGITNGTTGLAAAGAAGSTITIRWDATAAAWFRKM